MCNRFYFAEIVSYKSVWYLEAILLCKLAELNLIHKSFDSGFDGWGTVSAGDQLPYLANHQFTLMLGFSHPKLAVNLSARFMDEMRTEPGTGSIPNDQRTDAYFILDSSVSYTVHKNIRLFGSVTNVNDSEYMVSRRPAGLRPGLPRAFMAGLKADF